MTQRAYPILTREFPSNKGHLLRTHWTSFLLSLVCNKTFTNKSKRQQRHQKTSKAEINWTVQLKVSCWTESSSHWNLLLAATIPTTLKCFLHFLPIHQQTIGIFSSSTELENALRKFTFSNYSLILNSWAEEGSCRCISLLSFQTKPKHPFWTCLLAWTHTHLLFQFSAFCLLIHSSISTNKSLKHPKDLYREPLSTSIISY